jgi:hypothetical protein
MSNEDSSIVQFIDDLTIEFEKKNAIELRKKIEPILNITRDYISDNQIILYGGMAMNMYLPKKYQFYTEYDIPDYDGLIFDATNYAKRFGELLKKKKYNYILVRKALHEGTYTTTWEFKTVADFTELDKVSYNDLLKRATVVDTMKICPLNLIKSSGYIELCMPESSLFRWSKIHHRLSLLEKHHKVKSSYKMKNLFLGEKHNKLDKVLDVILKYVIQAKLPLVGVKAIMYYLKKDIWSHTTLDNFRYISCVSDTISETVDSVTKLLTSLNVEFIVLPESRLSSLMTPKVNIDIIFGNTSYKLMSIHNASTRCVSYVEVPCKASKIRVVSVFYILYTLYFYLYHFEANVKDVCNKQTEYVVSRLLEKNNNKSMFSTTCVGHFQSVSAVKKNRLDKNINGKIYSHHI